MSVTVRLWAGVKEAAGVETVDVDGDTVASVRESLSAALPAIAGQLPFCRYAVDDAFVGDETPVADGSVVDVIPPVSGG